MKNLVRPVLDATTSTKALSFNYLPTKTLKPDSANPRRHSEKQILQLANSIRQLGFNVPIIVDEARNILCGHARWAAANHLGMAEVPTICVAHLTKAQLKAFMIADNRLAEMAVWDDEFLTSMLQDLASQNLDFSIETTGFTLDEINIRVESHNAGQEGVADPDDQLPDSVEGPVISKAGDLWLLGENRLLHGDATKHADVEQLMNGRRAAMAFTDPPYGVDYGSTAKDKFRGIHRPILNDNLGDGFSDFLFMACSNILSVTDGAIYVCMSSSALHVLQGAFARAGGHWSTFIIWAKQTFEPPPIKESSLDSDFAIHKGRHIGGFSHGQEELFNRADHREAAAG